MKKILVPTDFSKYALNAAKFAAFLAKKVDAKIYFLHSVNLPSYTGGTGLYPSRKNAAEGLSILDNVNEAFEVLFKEEFLEGIEVESLIQYSDVVYDDIVRESTKNDVDLIVMGTHGTTGYVNDFLIGSNTDRMMRLSSIPVIAINDEVINPEINTIIFASDFGDGIVEAFPKVIGFAEALGAKVEMLRIITRDDFYYSGPMLDTMDNFAGESGIKNYGCHIWVAETVQSGISEYAERINADMIATITHGRRGLARLLNGSVTSKVVKTSTLPVFSVRI